MKPWACGSFVLTISDRRWDCFLTWRAIALATRLRSRPTAQEVRGSFESTIELRATQGLDTTLLTAQACRLACCQCRTSSLS
eukprot:751782-Hanusia_phi.AAC.5